MKTLEVEKVLIDYCYQQSGMEDKYFIMKFMKALLLLISIFLVMHGTAQIDSLPKNTVIVHSDYRLDILGKKEAELNAAIAKTLERSAIGYRLQILSTNDKELAFKTRTQLLQKFPDQKVYMYFLSPYVKLKFGNFRTKQEAETYRKQISKMLGGISIYLLNERVEVKPEKDPKEEEIK